VCDFNSDFVKPVKGILKKVNAIMKKESSLKSLVISKKDQERIDHIKHCYTCRDLLQRVILSTWKIKGDFYLKIANSELEIPIIV